MKCPQCGKWSSVKETRQAFGGKVARRHRECGNGHPFTTHEISAELFENILPLLDPSGLPPTTRVLVRDRVHRLAARKTEGTKETT